MMPTRPDNVVANLVYANPGHAVRDTMVDGKFVLRDRRIVTMDEGKFLKRADQVADQLLARAKWNNRIGKGFSKGV